MNHFAPVANGPDEAFALGGEACDPYACKILIDASDVVSFDFFDTLVTRMSASPEAVQSYTGHIFGAGGPTAENFFQRRRKAEDAIRDRRNHQGDVSIEEIYAEMNQGESSGTVSEFDKSLEEKVDLAFLLRREPVAELLRYASSIGKRVIIVSDTYYPRSFFESALRQLGLDGLVDELYLSAERSARKGQGVLWDLVRSRELVDGKSFIHFGDDARSDIEMARQRGLRCVQVAAPAAVAALGGVDRARNRNWRADILLGPTFARYGNDPFKQPQTSIQSAREFGHLVYGPVLFIFFAWLVQNPALRRMEKLYFAAREGYFLKRLYDTLTAEFDFPDLPPSCYLPISRRAVLMASQAVRFDPGRVLDGGGFAGSIADLLRARLGLALAPTDLLISELNLPADRDFALRVLSILEPVIIARAKREAEDMKAFLEEIGLVNKGLNGLVDIGYSGTIQTGLQEIVGRPMTGFYMATSERAERVRKDGGLAFGCFQDALYNEMAEEGFMRKTVLLEALLTAPHGQLARFEKDGEGRAHPVFLGGGHSQERFQTLEIVFQGALDYCRDLIGAAGPAVLEAVLPARAHALDMIGAVFEGRVQVEADLIDAFYLEDNFSGYGEIRGIRV